MNRRIVLKAPAKPDAPIAPKLAKMECQRDKLLADWNRWLKKQRFANNKVDKIRHSINRLDRRMDALTKKG